MVHDRLAARFVVASLQRRKQAHAVFGGIVGQLRTEDVRARGEKVGQADELIAGGAILDMAGPADDERNAMPAVKNIRLGSAEVVARIVSFGHEFVELRLRRATVVCGHSRVLPSLPIYRFEFGRLIQHHAGKIMANRAEPKAWFDRYWADPICT